MRNQKLGLGKAFFSLQKSLALGGFIWSREVYCLAKQFCMRRWSKTLSNQPFSKLVFYYSLFMCLYENYDQSFGSSRFVLELMREKPTHSLIEFTQDTEWKYLKSVVVVFRYVSTHPTPPPNPNLATSQSLYRCNNNRAVTCKFCSCKLCQFGLGSSLAPWGLVLPLCIILLSCFLSQE